MKAAPNPANTDGSEAPVLGSVACGTGSGVTVTDSITGSSSSSSSSSSSLSSSSSSIGLNLFVNSTSSEDASTISTSRLLFVTKKYALLMLTSLTLYSPSSRSSKVRLPFPITDPLSIVTQPPSPATCSSKKNSVVLVNTFPALLRTLLVTSISPNSGGGGVSSSLTFVNITSSTSPSVSKVVVCGLSVSS